MARVRAKRPYKPRTDKQREADRRMCSTEKLALLSTNVSEWEWGDYMRQNPPYTPAEFQPDLDYEITPRQARKRFYDFWDRVAP